MIVLLNLRRQSRIQRVCTFLFCFKIWSQKCEKLVYCKALLVCSLQVLSIRNLVIILILNYCGHRICILQFLGQGCCEGLSTESLQTHQANYQKTTHCSKTTVMDTHSRFPRTKYQRQVWQPSNYDTSILKTTMVKTCFLVWPRSNTLETFLVSAC